MVKVVRTLDKSISLFMFCLACTLFFVFFYCGTVKAQETENLEKAVDVGSSMLSEEENNKNGYIEGVDMYNIGLVSNDPEIS